MCANMFCSCSDAIWFGRQLLAGLCSEAATHCCVGAAMRASTQWQNVRLPHVKRSARSRGCATHEFWNSQRLCHIARASIRAAISGSLCVLGGLDDRDSCRAHKRKRSLF